MEVVCTEVLPVQSKWSTSIISGMFNPKQAGGGGGRIGLQDGSFLCCAEMVGSRKFKLCHFYYILKGFNSEYKPVPWDMHCCHWSTIREVT